MEFARPATPSSRAPPRPSSRSSFYPNTSSSSSSVPRTLPSLPSSASRSISSSTHSPARQAPLLPSFAGGKSLPAPPPGSARSTLGTDPRRYSFSSSTASPRLPAATGGAGGGARPSLTGVGRPPSPAGWGEKSQIGGYDQLRRPPSPARPAYGTLPARASLQALPPPRSSPSLSLHPIRTSSSSFYTPPAPPSSLPRRPPSPPLVSSGAGRPSVARIRRNSQVSPTTPTAESLPPSPSAPACARPSQQHHSMRSNEAGFRNLARRSSFSSSLPSSSSSSSLSLRPSLHAPLPSPAYSYASLQTLPTYSPELPLQNRPASPSKRSNFSAPTLRVLGTLWSQGAFYPSSEQVDEVCRQTGLTRTQVRNFFANKRQRATGEEKIKIQQLGRELSLVN
ncbi:hypothetical protein JCM8547_006769 [Rhodosporidiobolus lusitaniae]